MKYILTTSSLLFFILINIMIFSLSAVNGDEGIYISGAYQYAQGLYPHVDFWWPQGVGYPMVLGWYGNIFGFSLVSMRLFSVFFSVGIVIIFYLFVRYQQNGKITLGQHYFILVIILLLSSYWQQMSTIGTKESFVSFLLVASVMFLYIGVTSKFNFSLILSGLLMAILVATKPTYGMIGVVGLLYIIMYSNRKLLSVFFFVTSGILTLYLIHYRLLGSPNGVANMFENISYVASWYKKDAPYYVIIASFSRVLFEISLPSVFWLIAAVKYKTLKVSDNDGVVFLLFLSFMVVFISHILVFFSSMSIEYILPILPLFILGLVVHLFKLGFNPSNTVNLLVLMLFVPNMTYAINKKSYLYNHLWPQQLFENPNRRFTEHSKIIHILDDLSNQGYDNYLYIGRHHHAVITSQLKQSIYSVSGTVFMDLEQVQDRDMANRMKVFTLSNFNDLLELHSVIVVDYHNANYITALKNYNLDKVLSQYEYSSTASEDDLKVYWKNNR